MVALLVLFIILVIAIFSLIIFVALLLVALLRFVFGLQSPLLLVTALRTEPGLGLAHLIELLACATLTILVILKNLVLLVLSVLVLQLVNHSFRLLFALRVF